MLKVTPLEANFGAEVTGIDLSKGADEATLRALGDALYEHKVIAIRDQRFDEDSYLAFGRKWGTPIPHVLL